MVQLPIALGLMFTTATVLQSLAFYICAGDTRSASKMPLTGVALFLELLPSKKVR